MRVIESSSGKPIKKTLLRHSLRGPMQTGQANPDIRSKLFPFSPYSRDIVPTCNSSTWFFLKLNKQELILLQKYYFFTKGTMVNFQITANYWFNEHKKAHDYNTKRAKIQVLVYTLVSVCKTVPQRTKASTWWAVMDILMECAFFL